MNEQLNRYKSFILPEKAVTTHASNLQREIFSTYLPDVVFPSPRRSVKRFKLGSFGFIFRWQAKKLYRFHLLCHGDLQWPKKKRKKKKKKKKKDRDVDSQRVFN